jgi:hypothetical protein
MVIGFILFFVTGVAFGFAAPGAFSFLALAIPTFFAVMDALANGVDGHLLITFVIAIVLTVVGIVVGRLLADIMSERDAAY